MRGGQSVRAGEVPDKVFAAVPWVKRCTIWALEIITQQAGGLELCVYLHGADRPDDDVIGERMSPMTSCAAAASKAMVTVLPDFGSTNTLVCPDERGAQP